MIPLLQKKDKEFVSTLPKCFERLVNSFYKSVMGKTVERAKKTKLTKMLTRSGLENMVENITLVELLDETLVKDTKNVINNLEKCLFAKIIKNPTSGEKSIQRVPWIHGGITALGYDNAQEKIIGEWVKNRIINIFKVLPYNEKCNLLKYDNLAAWHRRMIIADEFSSLGSRVSNTLTTHDDDEEQDDDLEDV